MNTDEHRCESDDLRGFWDRLCTSGSLFENSNVGFSMLQENIN
jgi:hypothetical protein